MRSVLVSFSTCCGGGVLRFVLCAAALLLPSVARADAYAIEGSATYYTAADTVSVRLEFNGPPLGFSFVARRGTPNDPIEHFRTGALFPAPARSWYTDYLVAGIEHQRADVAYTVVGNEVFLDIPMSVMSFHDPHFTWYATGRLYGESGIDAVVDYTAPIPEPSSIALASTLLLCGVPLWRRYKRTRAKVYQVPCCG